jgi:endonuclease YncB( thermonuclease family)
MAYHLAHKARAGLSESRIPPEFGNRLFDYQVAAVKIAAQKAALALADWVGARTVSCATDGKDRYERWLARCAVGGQDLGQWMARSGWAVPYRDCKCEMIRNAADEAKAARAGIWSGTFQTPWDWRKAH